MAGNPARSRIGRNDRPNTLLLRSLPPCVSQNTGPSFTSRPSASMAFRWSARAVMAKAVEPGPEQVRAGSVFLPLAPAPHGDAGSSRERRCEPMSPTPSVAPVPSATSYDEVPYTSLPYPQTHPDRLATIATLM